MTHATSPRVLAARKARLVSENKIKSLVSIYENNLHEGAADRELVNQLVSEAIKYERLVLLEMLAGKKLGDVWKNFNGIFEAMEELGTVVPEVADFVSKFAAKREEVFDSISMKLGKPAEKKDRAMLENMLADVMVVAKAMMAINTSLVNGELANMLTQIKPDTKLGTAFAGRKIATRQELSRMSQQPTGKVADDVSVIPKLTNVEDDDDYLKGLPEGLGDMFKKKFGIPGFSPSKAVDEEKNFEKEVEKIMKTKAPGAVRFIKPYMLAHDLMKLSPAALKSAFSRFENKVVSHVDNDFLRATVMAASKTPFLKSVWDTLSGGLATRSRM